jgi:multiple sugar transport system substrate-binding protein
MKRQMVVVPNFSAKGFERSSDLLSWLDKRWLSQRKEMEVLMSHTLSVIQIRRWALLTLLFASLLSPFSVVKRLHAQDTVTLTYGWWSNGEQGDAAHRAWLDEFEASHPHIQIEAEFLPWGDYWAKLQTTAGTEAGYDIIGFTSSQAASYMAAGQLLDLTRLEGYDAIAARLHPNVLNLFNWDAHQYIIPSGIAVRSLGFRADFFAEAGIDVIDPTTPLTLDELITLGKQLTRNDNGQITRYAWNPNVSEPWYMLVANRGGAFFDQFVNPTRVTINTPEGVAGLRDFLRLFEEGIIPPWAEWRDSGWGSGGLDSLQAGTVAMADIGPWNFASIRNGQLPIASMVYPVAVEGQPSLLYSGANGHAINAASSQIAEAWSFLQWMTSQEAQLSYAQWSDIPANVEAFNEVFAILEPQALATATQAQLLGFRPTLMTHVPELESTIEAILRQMSEGELTPEEAAAMIESEGNALLAAG